MRDRSLRVLTRYVKCMGEKLGATWEAAYPYLIGLLIGVVLWRLPAQTPVNLQAKGFGLPVVYAALVALNTFGAGVMITVFVFTMAPAAGFVGKMEKLGLYRTFRRYIKEGVAVSLVAGTICIPLSAATPQVLSSQYFAAMSVLGWALTVCFVMLAYRVSRIFLFWASQN